MKTNVKEIAAFLKEKKEFIIYYHQRPDGDAVGAAYGLALGLRSLGGKCALRCSDPVPQRYAWLVEGIESDAVDERAETAAAVAVDSSAPSRLGRFSDAKVDAVIDHHEDNSFPAETGFVVPTASSCCELVLRVLREMGAEITPRAASLLFNGLVTDTDCFRSRRTTAESFAAAAELAQLGADTKEITGRYAVKSPQRMEIERRLCESFRYTCGGRVLGAVLTTEDYRAAGIADSELDGLNALVEQVEGVEMGAIVRELRQGFCRLSLRTAAGYRADRICARFGGGGHEGAAGAEIEGEPHEVLARVEAACAEELGEGK